MTVYRRFGCIASVHLDSRITVGEDTKSIPTAVTRRTSLKHSRCYKFIYKQLSFWEEWSPFRETVFFTYASENILTPGTLLYPCKLNDSIQPVMLSYYRSIRLLFKGCSCSSVTACSTRHCSCVKKSSKCGPGCRCKNCGNTTSYPHAQLHHLEEIVVEGLLEVEQEELPHD